MVYIPIQHLRSGMIVARDVTRSMSAFPLLMTGQKLSSALIEKLNKNNIQGVYVQSKLSNDVEINDVIDPQLKSQVLSDAKKFYDDCIAQVPTTEHTYENIKDIVSKMVENILSKEECMLNIMDMKSYDTYTYTHSMYVSIICILMGIDLGYSSSALNDLGVCGFLHDIGKLDIPVEIVHKDSKLTAEEFKIMKSHSSKAVRRLTPFRSISATILKGILNHHERVDGTGYPNALAGNQISAFGKIVAIADVYDALTSKRTYRDAWPSHEAIEYMMGGAGTHFDMSFLRSFLKVVTAYPVGTMVNLSNDYVALVIENNSVNILRPKIRIILPENSAGIEINLLLEWLDTTIISVYNENSDLPDSLFY